ncbi:hypothetical protein AGMMS4952_09590 [Spirochaetia bacterium]|nr:hypothetical protein AGMMS4952_09590 [Spirochaetia bacterium]
MKGVMGVELKKSLFVIILFSLTTNLMAQNIEDIEEIKTPKFSIQVPLLTIPIELLVNSITGFDPYAWAFNIEFQYAFNNYFTLQLIPTFGMGGGTWYRDRYGNTEEYNTYTYSLTAGILFHWQGTGLKGWFFGLDPKFGFEQHIYDVTDNLIDAGFMGSVGYQWVRSNGFTISYWFGVGSSWYIPFDDNKYEWEKKHLFDLPIDFGGNLSIGYSF